MKDFIVNFVKNTLVNLPVSTLAFYGVNGGAVVLGLFGNAIGGWFGQAPLLLMATGVVNVVFFRK